MRRSSFAYAALAGAALLYGSTFVIVKNAIEILPPFGFVGWRFLLGALPLLAITRPKSREVWRDGVLAGLVLFAGYALQTEGLLRTSPANSGLITGLYVIFTPLLVAGLGRRALDRRVLGGAMLAFGGFALLTEGFSPRPGDLLTVGCAAAFAVHIVLLTRFAPRHPTVAFTGVQLLTTSLLSLAVAAPKEGLGLPPGEVVGALAITGVVVSAGAFILQVWAQTVVGASRTAIMLSLEPAFAVAFAAWWADEVLTGRGWAGAVLIFVAIYVVLTAEDDELPRAEAISPAH